MANHNLPSRTIAHLLHKLISGEITPDEFAQLERVLMVNQKARQLYREIMTLHVDLYGRGRVAVTIRRDLVESLKEDSERYNTRREKLQRIEAYAQQQLEGFLNEQKEDERSETISVPRYDLLEGLWLCGERLSNLVSRASRVVVRAAAVLILMMALVGILGYLWSHRVVATLVATRHAQWEQDIDSHKLRPGWRTLKEGCVQVLFKDGAEVVIQAPCRFNLSSENKMICTLGAVTAQVTPAARGFSIETPSTLVTDYGTAFGIFVDQEESADVLVFDGEVGVEPPMSGRTVNPTLIKKGQNLRGSKSQGMQKGRAKREERQYIRSLPEPNEIGIPGRRLNLADIVGGGNGFGTGTVDQGFHMWTGEPLQVEGMFWWRGRQRYAQAKSNPYVDGVFVPDGEHGPIVVSSTGLTWDQCPDTTGVFYGVPFNGAWFLRPENPGAGRYTYQLNGRTYGPGTAALSMHSNLGITFDLDAVRHDQPGVELKRFTTLWGFSSFRPEDQDRKAEAMLSVLLDGAVCEQSRTAFGQEGVRINIDLSPDQRFLTLIVTDVDGQEWDWTFLAEPVIEMEHPTSDF